MLKSNLRNFFIIDEDFSGLCEKVNNFNTDRFLRATADEIVAMNDDAKKKHKDKAEQRKKTLEKAIQELKAKLAEQESELSKCEEVITAVEGPAEQALLKKAA